jgi:hypothetical protein
MARPDVPLAELYSSSRWLRFLFGKIGQITTIPGACLLWALVQTGLFGGLTWATGTLWVEHQPGELNLLEDTTALAFLLLLPFCFYLLHLNQRLFKQYLQNLDGVLEPSAPATAHADLVAEAVRRLHSSRINPIRTLIFGVGLLVVCFNAFTNFFPGFFYGSPQKWDGVAHPANYVAARLFVFVVWGYWIPTWISSTLQQFAVMNALHRRMEKGAWLRISPYALDQFGGLKPLATAASGTGYLILAAGCFFLAPLLRWVIWDRPLHVGNYVGLGAYVLLAFVGMFLPTIVLHRILSRKREDVLNFLNQAFDDINMQVSQFVTEKKTLRLGEQNFSQALESVDRLHTQWSRLPNWPMSWGLVLRFVATVVIPAIGYWLVQKVLTQWSP